MRTSIAAFSGFLVCLISGTVIAIIMQPYVSPHLLPYIRTEEQGIDFIALISGYAVIGLMLTAVSILTSAEKKSWQWILKMGIAIGLCVFLGDHLVTAGWSQLSMIPMAVSGVLDALSIVAAFAMIAYVRKPKSVRNKDNSVSSEQAVNLCRKYCYRVN